VNVDVDVPLFLPLSGQRRLSDLRYTAQQQRQGGFSISGQVNFESGWEFGFYLSNAVTARAIWNPRMEVSGRGGGCFTSRLFFLCWAVCCLCGG
jgi:hypothetical protein